MSSWLLNMYMDEIVWEVNGNVQGTGGELWVGRNRLFKIKPLLCAADTASVAQSEEKHGVLVNEFKECRRNVYLRE